MGHRLSKDGLSPDPDKVKAISDMPRPDYKKAVEHFLGCLQCLSRFLPQLAEVAAPLRLLTEQSAIFTWQTQQEEAFQALKTMIIKAPVLKFYDVKAEVTIQCDASEKGLGAIYIFAKRTAGCLCFTILDQSRTELCTNRKRVPHYSV